MTMFRISAKILGSQFWIWNMWEGKPLHESPLSPIVPPCDGEIKHDLWLDKFKMANLARKGSRKWNKSCDWLNNGKECCSVVSSRFFGVNAAWHPKKRLRRRLGTGLPAAITPRFHVTIPGSTSLARKLSTLSPKTEMEKITGFFLHSRKLVELLLMLEHVRL